MADETLRSGIWLNVVVGICMLGAVLLARSVDSGQLALTLLGGAALAALAGYVSAAWERLAPARRRTLAVLAALVGLALAGVWALQDEPVSTRGIEIALGVLALVVGAYAWWRAGRGTEAEASGGP